MNGFLILNQNVSSTHYKMSTFQISQQLHKSVNFYHNKKLLTESKPALLNVYHIQKINLGFNLSFEIFLLIFEHYL